MDTVAMKEKVSTFLQKYRFVLLVLAIGLVFMLLPSRNAEEDTSQNQTEVTVQTQPDITEELSAILSKIAGAGKVQVMLTVSRGESTVYRYDEDSSGGATGSNRKDTVIVTDSNRTQSGLIERIDPPQYMGAIIVCDGADSAAVRYSIIEAVSKVTGLSTERISVLKMK